MGMANFNYSARDNCWILSDKGGAELIRFGASKLFQAYVTTDWSNAATSFEPFFMQTTMRAAGGVGGRAKFELIINAAAGGWTNSLKASVTYGAAGRTTGLGSAFCAEITLSAGTSSGTFAPLESELTMASGALTGTATSFLYMNTAGTARTTFDTNGYLFELGAGIAPGSGKMIYDNTGTDPTNSNGSLRIRLPSGAAAYIMYYDQQAA